ncbi:hypothetical protein DM01DRAFT_1335422 [Hesseltinella vesiculosa]|uniref:Uncharacterized protein n=1 Tax=Hesseltinella vesiculosa TaxID=101127 RepID=A0A1X2GKL7_9FUNG|nr:hypothetical protein DM01DRAFT_1335422 [Hesseltinella vesiculosa]
MTDDEMKEYLHQLTLSIMDQSRRQERHDNAIDEVINSRSFIKSGPLRRPLFNHSKTPPPSPDADESQTSSIFTIPRTPTIDIFGPQPIINNGALLTVDLDKHLLTAGRRPYALSNPPLPSEPMSPQTSVNEPMDQDFPDDQQPMLATQPSSLESASQWTFDKLPSSVVPVYLTETQYQSIRNRKPLPPAPSERVLRAHFDFVLDELNHPEVNIVHDDTTIPHFEDSGKSLFLHKLLQRIKLDTNIAKPFDIVLTCNGFNTEDVYFKLISTGFLCRRLNEVLPEFLDDQYGVIMRVGEGRKSDLKSQAHLYIALDTRAPINVVNYRNAADPSKPLPAIQLLTLGTMEQRLDDYFREFGQSKNTAALSQSPWKLPEYQACGAILGDNPQPLPDQQNLYDPILESVMDWVSNGMQNKYRHPTSDLSSLVLNGQPPSTSHPRPFRSGLHSAIAHPLFHGDSQSDTDSIIDIIDIDSDNDTIISDPTVLRQRIASLFSGCSHGKPATPSSISACLPIPAIDRKEVKKLLETSKEKFDRDLRKLQESYLSETLTTLHSYAQ